DGIAVGAADAGAGAVMVAAHHRDEGVGPAPVAAVAAFVERCPAGPTPGGAEEVFELEHRRPFEAKVGVAPAAAPILDGGVVVGEVDAAGETDAAVHRQRLAMIAASEAAEHLATSPLDPDGVEREHARAGASNELEVRARHGGAPRVVEQAHLDAGARPLCERLGEDGADLV